jgi:hypothetical protein
VSDGRGSKTRNNSKIVPTKLGYIHRNKDQQQRPRTKNIMDNLIINSFATSRRRR